MLYDYSLVEGVYEHNKKNIIDTEKIDICILNYEYPNNLRDNIILSKKNITSDSYYTIFNIYKNEEESKMIRDICTEFDVSLVEIQIKDREKYVVLQRLGQKLNYIYNKYCKERKCKYFGLIQQDVFIVNKFDPINLLNKYPCLGVLLSCPPQKFSDFVDLEYAKKIWYLWEGFFFLKTEHFEKYTWNANNESLLYYNKERPYGECGIHSYYEILFKFDKDKIKEIFEYQYPIRHQIRNSLYDMSNVIHQESTRLRLEYIDDYKLFFHGGGCGGFQGELKKEIDIKNEILSSFLQNFIN